MSDCGFTALSIEYVRRSVRLFFTLENLVFLPNSISRLGFMLCPGNPIPKGGMTFFGGSVSLQNINVIVGLVASDRMMLLDHLARDSGFDR